MDAGRGIIDSYYFSFETARLTEQEEHFTISGTKVEEGGGSFVKTQLGRGEIFEDLLGGVDVGEPCLAGVGWRGGVGV